MVRECNTLYYSQIDGLTSDREWRVSLKELGYRPVPVRKESDAEIELFARGAKAVTDSRDIIGRISSIGRAIKSVGLLWISDHPSLDSDNSDLLGRLIGLGREEGWLDTENAVLLGIQSAGKKEREIIKSAHLTVYTMEDVDLMDLKQIMHRALRKTSSGTSGLAVYYNPDVSDRGSSGFTDRETHLIMEMTARSGNLKLISVESEKKT